MKPLRISLELRFWRERLVHSSGIEPFRQETLDRSKMRKIYRSLNLDVFAIQAVHFLAMAVDAIKQTDRYSLRVVLLSADKFS